MSKMFKYTNIEEKNMKALIILAVVYLGISVVLGVIKTIRFAIVFYPEQIDRYFITLCPYSYEERRDTWYERLFLPSLLVFVVLDFIVDMFISVVFWISTGKRLGHWY